MSIPHDSSIVYHILPNRQANNETSRRDISSLQNATSKLAKMDPKPTSEMRTLNAQLIDKANLLSLDYDLFEHADPRWTGRFDQRDIVTQRQAVRRIKKDLKPRRHDLLGRYKRNLARLEQPDAATADFELKAGSTIDQTKRWAHKELTGLNEQLEPLTTEANARISTYLDHLGITNRNINYRNNVMCSSPSATSPNPALKLERRPPVAPRWHISNNFARARELGVHNLIPPPRENFKKPWPENYIQAAGLEEKYPMHSIYQTDMRDPVHMQLPTSQRPVRTTHRYSFEQPQNTYGREEEVRLDVERIPKMGFVINPKPDFSKSFRLREVPLCSFN